MPVFEKFSEAVKWLASWILNELPKADEAINNALRRAEIVKDTVSEAESNAKDSEIMSAQSASRVETSEKKIAIMKEEIVAAKKDSLDFMEQAEYAANEAQLSAVKAREYLRELKTPATIDLYGCVRLAGDNDISNGAEDKVVTAAQLNSVINEGVADATEELKGKARFAAEPEVEARASNVMLSPSNISFLTPSEERAGVIKIASQAEVEQRAEDSALTPKNISFLTADEENFGLVKTATKGDIENKLPYAAITAANISNIIASEEEIIAGEAKDKAVSPFMLSKKISSKADYGLIKLASDEEIAKGSANDKAVTPKQLKDAVNQTLSYPDLSGCVQMFRRSVQEETFLASAPENGWFQIFTSGAGNRLSTNVTVYFAEGDYSSSFINACLYDWTSDNLMLPVKRGQNIYAKKSLDAGDALPFVTVYFYPLQTV